MGTNYYWVPQEPCPHCGRPYPGLHIGKSSAGWCFSLHVYPECDVEKPEDVIADLDDWRKRWAQPGSYIENEYCERISPADMEKWITERGPRGSLGHCPTGYSSWEDFHYQNDSQEGPNGLLRHRVDGRHCIRHGAGTWDLCIGGFS